MDLTLGGSCADGSPTHEIRHVLWRNHVEKLRASRYSHLCQIKEKATCNAQAVTDAERLVKERIVDQTLPAQSRARFLKVDSHHNHELAGKLCDSLFEQFRVLPGSNWIVDRAWTHND